MSAYDPPQCKTCVDHWFKSGRPVGTYLIVSRGHHIRGVHDESPSPSLKDKEGSVRPPPLTALGITATMKQQDPTNEQETAKQQPSLRYRLTTLLQQSLPSSSASSPACALPYEWGGETEGASRKNEATSPTRSSSSLAAGNLRWQNSDTC